MEVFLLLLDELDDAAAVLRSLLPRLASFVVAAALLFGAGFAFLRLPVLALPAAALLLGATLIYKAQSPRATESLPRDR